MERLSSTLETSQGICVKCGKRLKETEYYYLGNRCSDCNHIENIEMIEGKRYNGNPNFYHNMGIDRLI